ncbi:MAG: hypothetical protein EXS48_03700, partial [Candidatus Staskawiczbacteria bacterium]|nr:hypothetical protein [Candidatus Staskawiczbacteria bacterium]
MARNLHEIIRRKKARRVQKSRARRRHEKRELVALLTTIEREDAEFFADMLWQDQFEQEKREQEEREYFEDMRNMHQFTDQ